MLLLVHGGLWERMDADGFWARPGITTALRHRGLDVTAPDRLRHAPSWEAEAEHLAASLPDRPVTVIAGSNGCSAAVRLAVAHPDRVERLLLAWPQTCGDADVDARTRTGLAELGAAPATIEALLTGTALRGVSESELTSLAIPVGVLPSVPENRMHQRHTVDRCWERSLGRASCPAARSRRARTSPRTSTPSRPRLPRSSRPERVRTVLAAAGMFVGTNIDDLIVLTVLFLTSRAVGRPRPSQIWIGQYLGNAVVIAFSVLVALGLTVIPDRWVGLLGLLPFAMGVRELIAVLRDRDDDAPAVASGVWTVGLVTVVNGADNLSVYTPVFRTLSAGAEAATIAVFAVGMAVWCALASRLGSHRGTVALIERCGRWLVPLVFMAIGLLIGLESVL